MLPTELPGKAGGSGVFSRPHVETLEGGDRGRLGLSIQPGLSLMRPGKQNTQLGVPAVCVCARVRVHACAREGLCSQLA